MTTKLVLQSRKQCFFKERQHRAAMAVSKSRISKVATRRRTVILRTGFAHPTCIQTIWIPGARLRPQIRDEKAAKEIETTI